MGWAEGTSRQCGWKTRIQSTSVRHQHRRGSGRVLHAVQTHAVSCAAPTSTAPQPVRGRAAERRQHNVSSLYFPPFCENGFSGPWMKSYLWGGKGMRVRSLRSFSDTQQDESLPWLHETPSQNKQKKKKERRDGGKEEGRGGEGRK